jgi:hypothetical protein
MPPISAVITVAVMPANNGPQRNTENDMKTTWLLSATCAVALLGSASAWAQSTTPPANSMGMAMKKPMMHHHKMMGHMGKPMDMHGPSDADHSADMLNGKELTSPMSPASSS